MKKNMMFLLLIICLLGCTPKEKLQKENIIERKDTDIIFSNASEFISNNQNEYGYQWFPDKENENGFLIIKEDCDIEWIKSNFNSIEKYISVVEFYNQDPEIVSIFPSCTRIKFFNNKEESIFDLSKLSNKYISVAIRGYNLVNIELISLFSDLKYLDICCAPNDLDKFESKSLYSLTLDIGDNVMDFSKVIKFNNLKYLEIQNASSLIDIDAINKLNLEVLYILDETLYAKYEKELENLKINNPNLKIWRGLE